MNNYKPGNGWKRLAGAVYERSDGVRVHLMGLVRLSDKTIKTDGLPSNRLRINFLQKVNGGNRKRALLAWANELEQIKNLQGKDTNEQ